ncbi:hypothetical protein [Erythrobacter crassostreae]|uniref:DUF306 domain-containing protein n=1 Tax=Erythrobacter crassostreae TaxID=2828328 RepID=A0A9X1JJL9_9SPHN|nr:hypothetical protein [Erythrobacter crassostrea]MBV7258085.1 hypothetical protein [Erythrobacter crassostrea]
MRIRTTLCLTLAATLSACGVSPDPAEPQPIETPIPVEPDGGIGDGAEPIPEVTDETDTGAVMIPTRFQGVWDYEGGTCSPESDMRMEISGDEILFYESIGTLNAVSIDNEDAIVTLDMEGEGDTWQQSTRFSLVGEGDDLRLHTTEGDQPKQDDEYPAKKCPE